MQVEVHDSVVEATVRPRLIRLAPNLVAVCFTLMKLLPAWFMLRAARQTGRLVPGERVVETSSGTFGLALAILCRLQGLNLTLVTDPVVDGWFKRRLEALGARVDLVNAEAGSSAVQALRMAKLRERLDECPRSFWPNQYGNPDNPKAYDLVAELLADTVGPLDVLVGPVGSGGSLCGTTSRLRERTPDLAAVAVDTPGSVLFGLECGQRLLRGLGNSLLPPNLDHSVVDEVHWVGAAEAFLATRELHRLHALYMGPTSGAAWLVARWLAQREPRRTVAVIMPDEGFRYSTTIYDPEWCRGHGAGLEALPATPASIRHPADCGATWSRMSWGRRRLVEVVQAARVEVA